MKEQRQRVDAVNNAVETALPEVQYSQSRFVDTGFIRPVNNQQLDIGTVLKAVDAGTKAYQSSAYYKDIVRQEKVTAFNQVTADLVETEQYIVENNLSPEETEQYMYSRTSELMANVPQDASDNYKETYTRSALEKFGGMTRKAIAKNALFRKEEKRIQLKDAFLGGSVEPQEYLTELRNSHGNQEGTKMAYLDIIDKLGRDYADIPTMMQDYNEEVKGLEEEWILNNGPLSEGSRQSFNDFIYQEVGLTPLQKLNRDYLSIKNLKDEETGAYLEEQFSQDTTVVKAVEAMPSILANYRASVLLSNGASPESVGARFKLPEKTVKFWQESQRENFIQLAGKAMTGPDNPEAVKGVQSIYMKASVKEKTKLANSLKSEFKTTIALLKDQPNGGRTLLNIAQSLDQKGMSEIRNILDDEPMYKAISVLDNLGLPVELLPQAIMGTLDDNGKGLNLETVRKDLGGTAEDIEKSVAKIEYISEPEKKKVLDTALRIAHWSEANGNIIPDMDAFIENIGPNSYVENQLDQGGLPRALDLLNDKELHTPKTWRTFNTLPTSERMFRFDELLKTSSDIPKTGLGFVDYGEIEKISVIGSGTNPLLSVQYDDDNVMYFNISEEDLLTENIAKASKDEQLRLERVRGFSPSFSSKPLNWSLQNGE